MKLSAFFRLIRWKNLVILTTTLLFIKYGFINIFTDEFTLNHLFFFFYLLSVLFIAAAGYVINDIYDIETDIINKPKKVYVSTYFSINQAYTIYFILNITGVILGFIIVNYLQKPIFSGIYILGSFLLYYYSTTLKRIPFIGNFVVAFFISLTLVFLAFFDLILFESEGSLSVNLLLFNIIVDFAIFSFMLHLIREIVKDVEDIDGDKQLNMKTLPIYIGLEKTKIIILLLLFILTVLVVYFMSSYLTNYIVVYGYLSVTLIIPLFYIFYLVLKAKEHSSFAKISSVIKICMITGLIAIPLITLSLLNVI